MKIEIEDNMFGCEQEPASMEHIQRSDLFPKKKLVTEDNNLRVPFPLLSGECAEYLGRTVDGVIVLSNYRLLIRYKESFSNVPLGLIESVEMRDIFYLQAYCKDATVIRCAFSSNEACQDWFKRVSAKIEPQRKVEEVFAFCFHAWCADRRTENITLDECTQLCPSDTPSPYNFTTEVERLKFDLTSAWRCTEINKNFGLCLSYPVEHIVPKQISDEDLREVAGFRALARFPAVVWRNCRTGAVLVRSSQPEMGLFGWRNKHDEKLLSAIPKACALNPGSSRSRSEDSYTVDNDVTEEPIAKKLLIVDCRSYSAAFVNRAKGGGLECPEYYVDCEIQFMYLANIHAIRKSFLALRTLCSSNNDQTSWLSCLESTKWLHNIASLLKTASLVANVNEKERRSVLVHCSDGWDRTPQIISLAQLMLDPYYRTITGFEVLIEKEWLQFGHKFADRCGNGLHTNDLNERCPVFIQWLECVYQLTTQFPCFFEFNEAFLVKLVHHTYSCLFGTFLCNTVKERSALCLEQKTASVWSLLNQHKFRNLLYSPDTHEVLTPATHVQSLRLWASVYLSNNSTFAGPDDPSTQTTVQPQTSTDSTEQTAAGLHKTRSCENLLMSDLNTGLSRRKSDPNIAMDHCEQQTQKLLKDAIGGDSCSSESVKSSEIDRSGSEPSDAAAGESDRSENEAKVTDGESRMEDDVANSERKSEANDEVEVSKEKNVTNESAEIDGEPKEVSNDIAKDQNDDRDEKDIQHNELDTQDSVSEVSYGNEKGQNVGEDNDVEMNNAGEAGDESKAESNSVNDPESNLPNMPHNSHMTSDKGSLEMKSHTNSSEHKLGQSPPLSVDSENSIETISEGEESDGVIHCENKLTEPRKHSHNVRNRLSDGDSKDIDSKIDYLKLKPTSENPFLYTPPMESSSDTVVEVQNEDTCSSHTLTPSNSPASLQILCDRVTTNTLNFIENTVSISTSTSDLTDSRVQERFLANRLPSDSLLNAGSESLQTSLKLRSILSQTGLCKGTNGAYRGMNVHTSVGSSLQPTPVSPQSGNSTCPPTPANSDGKCLGVHVPRCGLSRRLDVDGLTKFSDPVQQEIERIKSEYTLEINKLQEKVINLQSILSHYASACNADIRFHNQDSQIESPGSFDIQSNAASDASWDQMDDPEVNIVRWVPDHTVTHCAGCDVMFSLLKRKHHCRNCGKIFCHSCSQETIPLPQQMIHKDERVCEACYHKISTLLSQSVLEIDSNGATAAGAST